MNQESLATKTTRSGIWLYGQKIVTNLINLGSVAILARKLDPSDFGLVALAGVVLSFAFAYGKSTTNKFVIYDRKEGWEERVQAAFWLNMTLIVSTMIIVIPLLPTISRFYNNPTLQPVITVILFRVFLDQVSVIPDALVRRRLNYQKLVVRNSLLQVTGAILSVGMALLNFGVWSLIIPGVILSFPKAIIAMWMASWVPKLPLRTQYWGEIFQYTRYIMGRTMLGVFVNDADTLVIGKLMGSGPVGIYDRAWRSANLTTKNMTGVFSNVAMPSLSSIASRPDVLRRAVVRMLRFLGVVTTPLLAILFVLADDFILTLYGPNWVESIAILRIFLLYTIIRSITSPVGAVFDATGRPDIPFKTRVILIPFLFLSIFIGVRFGLTGIAASVTMYKIGTAFLILYLACRLIKQEFGVLLKSLWLTIEPSLIMACLIWVGKAFMTAYIDLTPLASLTVFSIMGGAMYIMLIRIFPRYVSLLDEVLFALDSVSLSISSIVRAVLFKPSALPT